MKTLASIANCDAAILLSMIASAKHCGVDPWAWLTALFGELPRLHATAASGSGSLTIADLLPDAWLASNPTHRWEIDTIRRQERQRSRQQKLRQRKTKRR